MRILYAIQGTGNGHLSRARDIIPVLEKKGELDICISGCQADISVPYNIKFRFDGLSFIFGKNGGIDYFETYKRSNLKRLWKEVGQLPVMEYDLVISDFEPVSAWACYVHNRPCIGLSHQLAVVNKKAPKPHQVDLLGKAILKYYAPVSVKYGFHFFQYDKNIFTPVIRQEVRKITPTNKGHYTVYLPAFSDERIIRILACFPDIEWQVFSKHSKKIYAAGNIAIAPICSTKFLESLSGAEGVLCGAGFETPAEALYLKKKLLVIPMHGQFEQQCNAAALKMMGIPVLKSFKVKHLKKISKWLESNQVTNVAFPDQTEEIIEKLITQSKNEERAVKLKTKHIDSGSGFRDAVLQKIFSKMRVK